MPAAPASQAPPFRALNYRLVRDDTGLREPGASAVVYGGMEERGIAFEGLEEALAVPRSDLRLFGKPESFKKRRMGVAVANGENTDQARERAKLAASKVRPVKA